MSNLAVTLTVEELKSLVREAVREELGTKPAEDVMTRGEVAKMLHVDPVTVTRYVRQRGLPGKQVGPRDWRFLRSQVLQWLEEQAVKPGAPTVEYAQKIAEAGR